jgi:hypothetical protein
MMLLEALSNFHLHTQAESMSISDTRRTFRIGGTLARVTTNAFVLSARQIAGEGKFDSFVGIISNTELNKFFHDDLPRRPKP